MSSTLASPPASSESPSGVHNVVIVGSGPAGYSAGVYTARALLEPVLFEGSTKEGMLPGGQLTTTTIVENYLGFDSIDGFELTDRFKAQAVANGLRVVPKTVKALRTDVFPFELVDEDGGVHRAKAVIVATGAMAKKLDIVNGSRFWHHGISACATCDGALPIFRKKPIVVVGGGDTACEEALFLARYASTVYLVHRRDVFRASKVMLERVRASPAIQVLTHKVVTEADGDELLRRVRLQDTVTGEQSWLDANGLFFAIGHTPNTQMLAGSGVKLDDDGYVLTHDGTKTSVPGVFAAGDVQDKRYRQAITSAGTGCMAALDAQHWIETLEE